MLLCPSLSIGIIILFCSIKLLQTNDLDKVPEEVVAHSSRQELSRKHSDDGECALRYTVCVWIKAM